MPERIKYLFAFEDHYEELFFNLDEEALAYQQKFHPDVKMILVMDSSRTVLKDNTHGSNFRNKGESETWGIP